MGAAFVYAGAKTAPAYRTMVAYFLGVLGLVIMGAFIYFAVLAIDYWAIWGGAWTVLGLAAVTCAAAIGELEVTDAEPSS